MSHGQSIVLIWSHLEIQPSHVINVVVSFVCINLPFLIHASQVSKKLLKTIADPRPRTPAIRGMMQANGSRATQALLGGYV